MKVSQETENKITEMLSEMTVEEKIGQMQQISYESYRPEVFERFRALGAGSFLHVLGEEADEIRAEAPYTIPQNFTSTQKRTSVQLDINTMMSKFQ